MQPIHLFTYNFILKQLSVQKHSWLCTAAVRVDDPLTSPTPPPLSQQGRCLSAPLERVCWPLKLSSSLDADILILTLILVCDWYFALRKWFNWSFRKKLVVFRGRRCCWTENQFVRHEKAKVVRATLSGTITLFTTPTTTQWYFCNILPYLRRAFNFWLLWLRHFRAKFLVPRNFCLFACLNFKLVFLYLVPLDICVSRFLSPRTLPTEGYRKSKLGSIFHIQV